MILISYGFLLLWLPVSLLIYWYIVRSSNAKLLFLCAISYAFYGVADLVFLPLLLGLSWGTYEMARRKRFILAIGVNLAALAVFKYLNFGIENINAVLAMLNVQALLPLIQIALPLGISFYVFKHIGYLLDVRQNRYPATDDLLAFITFSAFFPQISAGPISSFHDTGKQLRNLPTRLPPEELQQGLLFLTIGLAKKLLIADQLRLALQNGLYELGPEHTGMIWAWFSVYLFALQIYFDFSGYTDTVLGIAALFGVKLPPNFNNPYLARTPAEFWQRWHISLSMWFRLYLFSPISRSFLRRLKREQAPFAQYVANLITMLLVGLWHGAGWGFILWGVYHALLLNFYAWLRRRIPQERISKLPLFLFIAVLIGWTFFLSPTAEFAVYMLGNMFGLNGIGSLVTIGTLYQFVTLITVVSASAIVITGMTEAASQPIRHNSAYWWTLGVLMFLAVLHLDRAVDFVYVNF